MHKVHSSKDESEPQHTIFSLFSTGLHYTTIFLPSIVRYSTFSRIMMVSWRRVSEKCIEIPRGDFCCIYFDIFLLSPPPPHHNNIPLFVYNKIIINIMISTFLYLTLATKHKNIIMYMCCDLTSSLCVLCCGRKSLNPLHPEKISPIWCWMFYAL